MSLTNSPFWMSSVGGASFYDYEINNSFRLDRSSNHNLSRTPASAGNRQKWTLSFWWKRGRITNGQPLFGWGNTNQNTVFAIATYAGNSTWDIYDYNNGTDRMAVSWSNQVRDASAWYHIVLRIDTTQATASNRVRLYINGEAADSSGGRSSYPSQNLSLFANNNTTTYVGRDPYSTNGEGYYADVHFIDGQSLDPSSFAETKSGIWVPKEYAGSYGTNGYFLNFQNSSALGTDSSGNANNFTVNNATAHDQMPDTPTNNFMTFNPNQRVSQGGSFPIPQQGNLRSYNTGYDQYKYMWSTMAIKPNTGKWYFEVLTETNMGGSNEISEIGLTTVGPNFTPTWSSGTTGDTYVYAGWRGNGTKAFRMKDIGVSQTSFNITNMAAGQIWQFAIDTDTGKIWLGLNNSWYDGSGGTTGNPSAGTNPSYTFATNTNELCFYAMGQNYGIGSVYFGLNAGADSSFYGNKTAQGNQDANGIGDFYYAPPTDFLSLCTANLPDPVIDPAQDDVPTDYFDTVLYTAASSNGTYNIGSASFVPDFSWVKNRDNVEEHYLFDVVRGNSSMTNKFVRSNNYAAEGAGGVSGTTVTSQLGGMQVVESSINAGELYYNSRTYAMWNWKAGGTASSNTNGTITSSVSTNQIMSVVGWTGNGTSGASIGHGLGKTPTMIIAKNRNIGGGENWRVWQSSFSTSGNLVLNNTAGKDTVPYLSPTTPTSNVFYVNNDTSINQSGSTYIAYVFTDIDGMCKAGAYIGNGSGEGPFVHTGFRPAYVMLRSTTGGRDWLVWDAKRMPFNPPSGGAGVEGPLQPNNASLPYNNAGYVDAIHFYSNGFQLQAGTTNLNANGETHIYMAFAEQPFKYANAR